ncbi:MAG: hypothetical protein QF825_12330, partial [SAR324 cluster bacterium]|nr:hypothetical protein [SAR324 cluster bacterium]
MEIADLPDTIARNFPFKSSIHANQFGAEAPCREYLRQFWHPIFIADDLGELSVAMKILGEEFVLFWSLSSRLGR